jgi:hypothetical protein
LPEDFGDPAPEPTDAPPGSHAKINELRRRFRRGLNLFHKDDARRLDPVLAKEVRRPEFVLAVTLEATTVHEAHVEARRRLGLRMGEEFPPYAAIELL